MSVRLGAGQRVALWTGFIIWCIVPWNDPQNHAHWIRVQWIPFVSPPVKSIDILGNIALFVPFGYWCGQFLSKSPALRTLAWAALLSITLEATQLYSHSRFPSATDVACNLFGTFVGVAAAAQWLSDR